jgi:hypothetical protein
MGVWPTWRYATLAGVCETIHVRIRRWRSWRNSVTLTWWGRWRWEVIRFSWDRIFLHIIFL